MGTKGINKRKPTHPGGILKRHYIEPLSLTISGVAKDLGVSRKAVSKIINEKGSITSDMALRLSKAFNTTPVLWLNLQLKYNLWLAEQKSTGLEKIKLLVPAYWTQEQECSKSFSFAYPMAIGGILILISTCDILKL
jgi:addiction module HigA family antidote